MHWTSPNGRIYWTPYPYETSQGPGAFTQILKEKQSHTLDNLYGVGHIDHERHQGNQVGLKHEIQERYEEFGLNRSNSARVREGQEREVAQEKEEERQIE